MCSFTKYIILILVMMFTVPAYAAVELSADELYWLGSKYEHERNYIKAIEYYTEIIKINPNYNNIYAVRGLTYIWLGKYDLALADYSEAIKLNPNDSGFYHNRGNIYNTKKQYDLAVEQFTKAIEIRDSYMTRKARGKTYSQIHKYDLAMNDFNRMDELWPGQDESVICKANLYGVLKKYEECITLSQKGLIQFADHPILLFLIAQSYEEQGNIDEAIYYYKKAYKNQSTQIITRRFTNAIKAKIEMRLANDWSSYKEWIDAY